MLKLKTTASAFALVSAFAIAPLAAAQTVADGGREVLGNFDNGQKNAWWAWSPSNAVADMSFENDHAVVVVEGTKAWQAQFGRGVRVAPQTTYEVSFDAWADVPRNIRVLLRNDRNAPDFAFRTYRGEGLRIGTSRKRHSVTLTVPNLFTDDGVEDATAQLLFHLGQGARTRVMFDDIAVEVVGEGADAVSGALNRVGAGDFETGAQQGFYLYADHALTNATFDADGELGVSLSEGGTEDWHVQLLRNVGLRADATYALSFSANAEAARSVNVQLTDPGTFANYDLETVQLREGGGTYSVELQTKAIERELGRLAFRLGGSEVDVSFDDIRLVDIEQIMGNGGFDSGTDGWTAYSNTGAVELAVDGSNGGAGFEGDSLRVSPRGATGNWWDGGVFTELQLKPSQSYEVSFATEGDARRTVNVQVLDDGATWTNTAVEVTSNARKETIRFSTGATLSGQAKLFVFFGDSTTPFRLDSVSVREAGGSAPQPGPGGEPGSLVSADDLDRRGYAHTGSLLADQARLDRDVEAAYSDWAAGYLKRPSQAYIDANGGGEMLFVTGFDQNFVGRPEKGAVSEGLGYGLAITALMDDREAFDRIWRFSKTKLNSHGLMHWLYDDEGNTVDFAGGSGYVNATDGDLDAAYGLLVAAARWGGSYAADADRLIDNILEHNVTDDNYLTSGDDGYDEANKRATLNRPLVTSYISPGYFRMFADFTGDARWDAVADRGMQQLRDNQAFIRAKNGGANRGGDGLISFRVLQDGAIDPTPGGNIYHSDGARAPWRVATDYAWFGTGQARDFMGDFNNFARRQGLDNLNMSYDEFGNWVGNWAGTQAGWMSGPLASSMLVSGNSGERDLAWNELMTSYSGGYYSASCRMLGILTAAGRYQNPVVPR